MRRRPSAVGGRVLQQVAQRGRPAGNQHPVGVRHINVMPELREIGGDAVEERMEVHHSRLFPLHVLADEGESVLGHALHLVERGENLRLRLRFLDELGAQAQARDRGPEVVRDRGRPERAARGARRPRSRPPSRTARGAPGSAPAARGSRGGSSTTSMCGEASMGGSLRAFPQPARTVCNKVCQAIAPAPPATLGAGTITGVRSFPMRPRGGERREWSHLGGGDEMQVEARRSSTPVRRLPPGAVCCHIPKA